MNTLHRATLRIGVVGGLGCLIAATATAADPTSVNPPPPPLYTFADGSPSTMTFEPGDVVLPPGPVLAVSRRNLGLFSVLDEVDGLSLRNADIGPLTPFALFFSVDAFSAGAVPPDPMLVAMGFPYNVQDQATKNQAAADVFVVLAPFNRGGPIGGTRALGNNSLVRNQGDAGGSDVDATPPISPDAFNPDGQDDMDGGTSDRPSAASGMPDVGLIYFSLRDGSPSLFQLPGQPTGATIFVDVMPDNVMGTGIYATPSQLGLTFGDEVSSFEVFDSDGPTTFGDPGDLVLFTLSEDSLSGTGSGADIFAANGSGSFVPYAFAEDLGLLMSDRVDMLAIQPCPELDACLRDWLIGRPCPEDLDGDGMIGLGDLGILLSCWMLPCGDVTGDNMTNLADIGAMFAVWDEFCPTR